MSLPQTYLLTAPSDADNLFGTGMSSHTLVSKLQKINPSIWVEANYPSGVWFPGKATGLTCLWFGEAGNKAASTKITGFIPGVIPEFTQLDERGAVMNLGWRRILEKAIAKRAVPYWAVENAFGVTLDVRMGQEDGWCHRCRKKGKFVRATSKMNQCSFHVQLDTVVDYASEQKRHKNYLRRKHA